jgi:hypothetical protein
LETGHGFFNIAQGDRIMSRVDTLEWNREDEAARARPVEGGVPPGALDASPFFWWVRAILAAGGAIALFPVVFAVAVKVIDLGV